MLLVDARRLTGPNLLAWCPLVVVELALDVPDDLAHACDAYFSELARIRAAVGVTPEVIAPASRVVRRHRGGAVVAYSAPLDLMLACAEMSEWAALSACEILASRQPLSLAAKAEEVSALLTRDRSPQMVALADEAKRRGLPFLWDDKEVSVGVGARSITYARSAIPDTSGVPWADLGSIPIALITGTNGKTTTTRLLAKMAMEAGRKVGSSSSDALTVGDDVIDTGDWTGPVAARTILRRKDVDMAILETARGGLLRRGLAMESVDAAVITNVSEDHTGGYGIDDLDAMTMVKALVARAVRPSGTVVLSAHDPKLVKLAETLKHELQGRRIVFFADLDRPEGAAALADARAVIEARRADGVVVAEGGKIVSTNGALVETAAIPITFGGAARYNVENALAAVAMAEALGLDRDAIARSLLEFRSSENPRRGVLIERPNDVRVMLDFGHNPEGVRAILSLVDSLRGTDPARRGRLFIVAGSAGDRTNLEIGKMCEAIAAASPFRVFIRELSGYMRGRMPGEIPLLFKRSLSACGLPDEALVTTASEVDALQRFFAEAKPHDFALILVHLDHDEVQRLLT